MDIHAKLLDSIHYLEKSYCNILIPVPTHSMACGSSFVWIMEKNLLWCLLYISLLHACVFHVIINLFCEAFQDPTIVQKGCGQRPEVKARIMSKEFL